MSEPTAHIMLVEDSPTQATRITHTLKSAGWQVTRVASGEDALKAISTISFDLVLLDFHLPDMRGDEICRRIRRNIDSRNLPIVILTSAEGNENEVLGLDSGADDYVSKSAASEVLVLKLRTLLGKAGPQSRILGANQTAFRSARLLAVDDSRTFLERLRLELETEGYEVVCADSPAAALERVAEEAFDGIIIDLVMPGMDGFELCRRIDEFRRAKNSKVVTLVLTARDTPDDHSKALEAGADDFVAKATDVAVLKGRIRALLRRKFFEEENRRIVAELNELELEALRERAAKEAAEARAHLVEELQRVADELRCSQAELEKANQAKDQFLAILSHELRTPLTPVLAAVGMRLEDDSLSPELRAELLMMKRNIELEALLIDDLLDLTRITRGKLELRCSVIDLRQIVAEALEISASSYSADKAAKIQARIEADETAVWGEGSRLTQVLWNLLRNALKFTPATGEIHLRVFHPSATAPEGKQVCIEVRDTGLGIDPSVLPSIFNAFEQGGRDVTRQFGGLGLGLAISKAIVEQHAGTITVHSDGRDKGATFTVTLPVTRIAPSDLVLPVSVPSAHRQSSEQVASGARILLVEDHADTSEALQRLLRRRGFDVTSASTVAEARELAAAKSFDVLVSDLNLPDGTGFELLQHVRLHQNVYAIALSGFGMEQDVQRSSEHGFAQHLTKPVEFKQLEAALAAARSQ